jgi:ankyrin repeat protein
VLVNHTCQCIHFFLSNVVYLTGWPSQLDLGVEVMNCPIEYDDRITVFDCAARAHDIPLIRRLLRIGYDINAVGTRGDTAVFNLATHICTSSLKQHDGLAVLGVLCDEGADVNFTANPTGDANILYWFIHSITYHTDCTTEVLELLIKHGASLSRALHAVGEHKSCIPFIRILLDAGADIEEVWDDMTPLTRAASKKNPEVVQALIDAGADVSGGSGYVYPLFAAVELTASCTVFAPTTAATIITLCDAGADANTVLIYRNSLLSYVLTYAGGETSQLETWDSVPFVLETLCQGGADVNFHHNIAFPTSTEPGDTPLHIAAGTIVISWNYLPSSEAAKYMEVLIAYGANVNSQNNTGRTPLHVAVARSDLLLAQVLLKHGARTNLKDNDGKTALMLAQEIDPRNEEISKLLEEGQQEAVDCM